MFKKSLLALAVITATTGVANAATVFDKDGNSFAVGGRVQSLFQNASVDEDKSKLVGSARLNIQGKAKITDGFSALGFAEWNVAANNSDGDKFNVRYAYVGVESDNYGTLVLGQTDTAIYNVIAKTDVFEEIGSAGNTYWDLGGRQEGQAVYQYKNAGFSFGASYQTSYKVNDDTKVNGGFAAAIGYGFDVAENLPLDFQLGYDRYVVKGKNNNPSSYAFSVSLGNVGEGFYSAFLYQHSQIDNKAKANGYEFTVGYGFENGFGVLAGYETLNAVGDNKENDVNNILLNASYQVNDNFFTYVEGALGVGGSNTQSDHNKAFVGVRYVF